MRTPEELEPLIRAEIAAGDAAVRAWKRQIGEALLEARVQFADEARWRAWLKRHFDHRLNADRAARYMAEAVVLARQEEAS